MISLKLIQTILTLVLIIGIVGGLIFVGVFLDRNYLRPVQATNTPRPNPPGPWNTATVYPTVAVEDLPFGMNEESPIQAARTAIPTEVPLSAIFAFSQERANEYWAGFRPGYAFSFINTAGSQRVRQGTAHEAIVLEWRFFNWSWEFPGSRLEVGAYVDTGIIVGFTRDAIVKSIADIFIENETINVRVDLPSECAVVVAVPIVDIDGEQMPTPQPDITLERINYPAWWSPNWVYFFDETELNQEAIGEATVLALTALLEEDILHQYHVASVRGEPISGNLGQSGFQEPARATIEDIAREAICWKLAQNGRSCDPTNIVVEIVPGPAPDRLLRCGSGHVILDVPYASKHVELSP